MRKVWVLCCGLAITSALACGQEDGGPDFYAVKPGAKTDNLQLRAEPKAGAKVLAQVPAGASCLRNLGCHGGLTMKEFSTLSAAEKSKRAAANPRWCQVEFKQQKGWLMGDVLIEGACAESGHKISMGQSANGSITGDQNGKYILTAVAGQKLEISLKSSNPSLYFNVLPPGSEEALFIGSTSGNHYSGTAVKAGDYTILVYFMRSAARRNAKATYMLTLGPAEAAGAPKVWPARFNATGMMKCSSGTASLDKQCTFRVVRKPGGDGTELWLMNANRKSSVKYRMLRYAKNTFTTNDGTPAKALRKDDNWELQVGEEYYFVPDAAIFGG